ncbi:hypothetical protein [uncultured Amnibacterium sp.]|uniref:hypothetical protein n=1 Tax=uncultured Amnibacterium sp. TaxID=1631851 RepID=UPI0035CC6239
MAASPDRTTTTTMVGGGLLTLAGLLLVLLLLVGGSEGLALLSAVALAAGACVLAFGVRGDDVVGGSLVGRIALVVLGVGPLVWEALFALPLAGLPALVTNMTLLGLVTVATVVAATSVVRARVLHGVARWVLLLVAAEAVLTAAMSTVPWEPMLLLYVRLDLELLRPIALLVAGVAFVLHGQGPAIRRRLGVVNAEWKRTTEVGGGTLDREREDAR